MVSVAVHSYSFIIIIAYITLLPVIAGFIERRMREENLTYPKIDSDEVKKKNKSLHKKLDVCGKPRTVLVTKNEVQFSFNGELNVEAQTVKGLEKLNVQKEKKRRKKNKKKQLKEDHLENKGSSLELCKSQSTTSISVIKERGLFRKKLLILDINGLLADILCPAPKDHTPDIKIAGRAGDNSCLN